VDIELAADGGELNIDDIAQLLLGKLGNPDQGLVALDLDPLVVFRVKKILGIHGAASL
jgi:hypothetical protein